MSRTVLVSLIALALSACSQSDQAGSASSEITSVASPVADVELNSSLDELDPFAADIEEQLAQLDKIYEQETGRSAFVADLMRPLGAACFRATCPIWIQVSRSRQKLYLYLDGRHEATWLVSTGAVGYTTPNFDINPNGRIYDRYSSKAYPGGDYQGLGNMPYAIFIKGGFALHGTAKSNWKRLGSRASHGCIRMHPDNALYVNRLVRQQGIYKTWITVQD